MITLALTRSDYLNRMITIPLGIARYCNSKQIWIMRANHNKQLITKTVITLNGFFCTNSCKLLCGYLDGKMVPYFANQLDCLMRMWLNFICWKAPFIVDIRRRVIINNEEVIKKNFIVFKKSFQSFISFYCLNNFHYNKHNNCE